MGVTPFLVLLALLVLSSGAPVNTRPIIGILTQPTSRSLREYGSSYIAASYVKYVESAGARVVPIFHNSTRAEQTALFKRLNGILFPGGGSDLDGTTLYNTGAFLYNLAKEANARGDYFPIQGHCLGFELMCIIVSGKHAILSEFDAENIPMHLEFLPASKDSRMFGAAPPNVMRTFATVNSTMNNHMYGVLPEDFVANEALESEYDILTTNVDRQGRVFVSTIEHKEYPFYGLQWHPEKNMFEWDATQSIPHSTDAVLAAQYTANFFVSEARKSAHKFPTPADEVRSLIYNYNPIYTADKITFQQCYVFP